MKLDIDRLQSVPWYWFLLMLIGGLPMVLIYLWDEDPDNQD